MVEDSGTIASFFNKLPPEIIGVLMAMFIAILRVIYDKEETSPMRITLESLLCGALSFTANFGIIAMGLDSNWSVFIGGSIGYFGSTTVRAVAIRFLKNKVK